MFGLDDLYNFEAGLGSSNSQSTGLGSVFGGGSTATQQPLQLGNSGTTGGGGFGLDSLGGIVGVADILSSLGGLYMNYRNMKLAKDSLKFKKEFATKQLNNQVQSYNTNLNDRISSRFFTEGKTQSAADEFVEKHSLKA